jgi:hypothetical protein
LDSAVRVISRCRPAFNNYMRVTWVCYNYFDRKVAYLTKFKCPKSPQIASPWSTWSLDQSLHCPTALPHCTCTAL